MIPYNFSSLIQLYENMDRSYDRVADRYNFHCDGCSDNCCTSLFFHHTFIEKAYLIQGFLQMTSTLRKEIQDKAADYVRQTFAHDKAGQPLKLMCPLNHKGRCTLYIYRPMICRLHGLPHELHPPGRRVIRGPGCDAGQFATRDYIPFDRTPFYTQMAALEQQFKKQQNRTGRIRETIAQMLLDPGN
ncbi:YkgJ family cysteine cluster protein [Desulfotignum phosphitoxidans]|uniref:YkgJ family cysteine cluster protein n=2 Tax=Desulfotignum TaxID=115780 RepID=S0G344_9BACT|nr:YkgJ family cysteine cluster protein [Desulfotignum phosphitoxidans]EMS78592.1 hypothetical protein Dpo_7c00650 [Desulfotignum phosphitoxidans DSM 13687]MBG0780499.1 YkgJ family cysteine cluster protein [Desulfotignum balticum]